MSKTLKANGDVWQAVPGGPSRRAGYRTVVFLCESNGQRPYRVVELAHDGADMDSFLAGLSSRELGDLFDSSTSLGAPAN